MPSPSISIIIVTWNSAVYLARCLNALNAQTFKDFEVVVIDNHSTDDFVDNLAELWPALNMHVVSLEENKGFSVANNLGAHLAHAQWMALLNPDAFPEPDWLEQLHKAIQQYPQFSFFSSRQIQADQTDLLDGEGDAYHVSGLAWRDQYEMPVPPSSEPKEVFSACAAAGLYRRSDFLEVGGFDEDFFSYHEDVDLGFRLRLMGKKCLHVPKAIVYHVGSASSGKLSDFSVYHGHRNLVWTFFKNMPGWLFWAYLPLHLAVNIYLVISYSFRGRGAILLRAKRDAILGLPLFLRKRRDIQKSRKASPSTLHAIMSRDWLEPHRISRRHKLSNHTKTQ